jgi:hypothetical protein
MTGSAIGGSDVAGAVDAKIPDIAALIRATLAYPGYACIGETKCDAVFSFGKREPCAQ